MSCCEMEILFFTVFKTRGSVLVSHGILLLNNALSVNGCLVWPPNKTTNVCNRAGIHCCFLI